MGLKDAVFTTVTVVGLMLAAAGIGFSIAPQSVEFDYDRLGRAVLKILPVGEDAAFGPGGRGTGFLVEVDGLAYVLTAGHVCGHATQKAIDFKDQVTIADTVLVDHVADICTLKLREKPQGTESLKMALEYQGRRVFMDGWAFMDARNPQEGLTTGLNTVQIDFVNAVEVMHTTLRAFPGNSGSPVVTADFKVVGMMIVTDIRTWMGAMVPLAALHKHLNL